MVRALAAGGLALIALAYYKPVRSYFETKQALSARLAEVRQLRQKHDRLRRRLRASTADAVLAAEARRLGFVRPGERLFIVTGIKEWERREARLRASPGANTTR